jgi:hypothetical protein
VLVDTVLDEPDGQHHDRTRCAPSEGLRHQDFERPRFVRRPGAGDYGNGEGLQEVAAYKSPDQASDIMADSTKAVLVESARCDMAADNDLDQ